LEPGNSGTAQQLEIEVVGLNAAHGFRRARATRLPGALAIGENWS